MTDGGDDYTPIDCGLYSRYELAIMHRERLRVSWCQGGECHIDVLTPRDLVTREGAEFMIADDSEGGHLELRLDHIRSAEPIAE